MIKRKLIFTSILFTYFMLVISCNENPEEYAVIITEKGKIFLRFFPEIAPKHVESFKILAREGLYNGTSFHRVISDFVIQGGDPNSRDGDSFNDGQGGRAGKYFGVGEKKNPENGEVTTEMVVEIMMKEFPEFLAVVAEENWIRGYKQAIADVEEGEKFILEEMKSRVKK